MPDAVQEYFEALDRLTSGKSQIVSRQAKINNDTVAIEAGRHKGSIKKSRPVFAGLIDAIKKAGANQVKPHQEAKENIRKFKVKSIEYRILYEQGLGRELALLRQVNELRQEINRLNSNLKVVRIREQKKL